MRYDAIIIGAGMSGLAAGIRLAMFDKRVVILERHYVWGGLNSFYQFKGRQFDVGPQGNVSGELQRQRVVVDHRQAGHDAHGLESVP